MPQVLALKRYHLSEPMAQRYAAATTKGDIMKKALLIWVGFVLASIAVAFAVSVFQSKNYVGGPILAAVFAAAAGRTWYLAGDSAKPPTGVEG